MDINEQIVRAWLQEQGFLVRGRLKFKVKGERKSAGWSDVDLIGYNPRDGRYVAVDISAWMSERISLSYVRNKDVAHRLFKVSSPEARKAIRDCLGLTNDNQYETWLVVSFISETQREEVLEECLKHVDRVIEFPEIMKDLIESVKKNPKLPREEESL
ncbi:MAG: hypothetical protein ACTSWF_12070 [Candidatus Freyarchaeota archaeon]